MVDVYKATQTADESYNSGLPSPNRNLIESGKEKTEAASLTLLGALQFSCIPSGFYTVCDCLGSAEQLCSPTKLSFLANGLAHHSYPLQTNNAVRTPDQPHSTLASVHPACSSTTHRHHSLDQPTTAHCSLHHPPLHCRVYESDGRTGGRRRMGRLRHVACDDTTLLPSLHSLRRR